MDQMFKKAICMIMSVMVIFTSTIIIHAEEMESNSELTKYERILYEAGTPKNVLAQISEGQQEFIVENLLDNAIYEGIENFECGTNTSNIARGNATLSESRIQVTVVCYQVYVNGERQFLFFPSFKWLETGTKISNDTFAFALYSGWEVVPNSSCHIKVNLINSSGVQQTVSHQPTDCSQYGYGYSFPGASSAPGGYYEGHAVCYARKKDSNATNGISVKYVHDTSRYFNVAYGINIGVASIAVSSNSSYLEIYARNMNFNYNSLK